MYKIIFIDIDGTLKNDKKELTNRTIDAIKKVTQNGILVVLTTGRPRKYTEDISRKCFASKYIITSSGGNIYDYEEKKNIFSNIMNKEAIIKLYDIAIKNDIRFIMNVDDTRAVNKLKYLDGSEFEVEESNIHNFIEKSEIVQCTLADKDYDKIKNIKNDILNIENVEIKNQHKSLLNSNYSKEGTIYYDVSNIELSKGDGIEKLCNYLNISLEDAIAIGDDYNDVSMFEKAGYSVVMDNANDEVKSYADKVIKSNNEDGVAKFIEELVFE